MAIAEVTAMMASVTLPPKGDMDIFVEFILPKLDRLCATEQTDLVKIMLGRQLATLAVTASRLFETSWGPGYSRQPQLDTPKRTEFRMSYDVALDELRRHFIRLVNVMLTPPSAAEVRLVVLQDIGSLCSFFGQYPLTILSRCAHGWLSVA